MSKTEMPQWSMVSSSVFPRRGTVGFSKCSGIPELHPEFSWDILADLPLTCLLVCPSLLTTKTPIAPLPWKHTKMHAKGRTLKETAPFISSLSRCLSYSVLSTPEMLRMAVRDIAWVLNCLTRRSGSSGGKVRSGRKTEEFRTKDHWNLTWLSLKEAN